MKLVPRALVRATLIGSVLQVAMATLGHGNGAVRNVYAPGGMGLSLIAGIFYAVFSTEAVTIDNVGGGAIAGAACAFIGILVAVIVGDVPATLLLLGTISSALTGAMGGWVGRLFSSGRV
jgi:hypothetical protein